MKVNLTLEERHKEVRGGREREKKRRQRLRRKKKETGRGGKEKDGKKEVHSSVCMPSCFSRV